MNRNQLGLALALAVAAVAAVLVPRLYDAAATGLTSRLPTLRNKRVCLLIAHPDDEAMFFAPTLLALTRPAAANRVSILCLSTGNARGLGAVRRRELVDSAMLLGLCDPADVVVIDRPTEFPDFMTASWDEAQISRLLAQTFIPPPDADAPPSIDLLITFDRHGVSAHPNHIALCRGARAFAQHHPIHVYNLVSVGLVRKYLFLLDLAASLAAWCYAALLGPAASAVPPRLLFLNRLAGDAALPAARRAMTHAHKSQMAWFRHLYILFSRYMLINDLCLVDDLAT